MVKFVKDQVEYFKKIGFAENVSRTVNFDVGDGYGVQWKRILGVNKRGKIVKLDRNQKDQYFGNT
jgi:hypothetical protein